MSAVPPFDTLKLSRALQAGGFSADQADATAHALADATLSADVATKADIVALRAELKGDIGALRVELKGDIGALRAELKGDIGALSAELRGDNGALKVDMQLLRTEIQLSERNVTIRLGGMIVVAVGVMLTAIRYLPAH